MNFPQGGMKRKGNLRIGKSMSKDMENNKVKVTFQEW